MTLINEIEIVRGNEITFGSEILANNVPLNCTDYDAIMVIKARRVLSFSIALKKKITWINRSTGTGRFLFTSAETGTLSPKRYEYEAYLYDTATGLKIGTYQKGLLSVQETLTLEPASL